MESFRPKPMNGGQKYYVIKDNIISKLNINNIFFYKECNNAMVKLLKQNKKYMKKNKISKKYFYKNNIILN